MTVVLAIAAIVALLVQAYRYGVERERAQKEWALERRELLNRIQAPAHIPMTERAEFVIPDREPDEWAKVGQIDIDPEYGLED